VGEAPSWGLANEKSVWEKNGRCLQLDLGYSYNAPAFQQRKKQKPRGSHADEKGGDDPLESLLKERPTKGNVRRQLGDE